MLRIMLDPSANNTDVYAFTAPDAPGKLTAGAEFWQVGRLTLEPWLVPRIPRPS